MNTQLCPTTAFYLGVVLIASTAITTLSLRSAGFSPILLILTGFMLSCLLLTNRLANLRGRLFLATSGISCALICHFALAWFITLHI